MILLLIAITRLALNKISASLKKSKLKKYTRRILTQNEFKIAYQPVYDSALKKYTGVEALLRIPVEQDHIDLETFLATARSIGLQRILTEKVCAMAIQDHSALHNKQLSLSINIHPSDLESNYFPRMIEKLAKKNKIPNNLITLEITEQESLNYIKAKKHIENIRSKGFLIAIDDFGSGHANISHILGIEFDIIKLDKIFTSPSATQILEALLKTPYFLNHKIVAEGIETDEQYTKMKGLNIHTFQGWYFSKAIPHDQLEGIVNAPQTLQKI